MGVHLCSTRNQGREKIEIKEMIGELKTVFIKQELREKIKADGELRARAMLVSARRWSGVNLMEG